MVIMAWSSGSGFQKPITTPERDLEIPREEHPDWAKEGHYDGVMLYDSRDADEAFIFKQIIEKFIVLENGQNASLCVLDNSDNLVWVQGRFSALEEAIRRSTFLFLFMTEHLCDEENHYAKWLRDETLMEVLHNKEKHWCLVPIHTRKRTSEGGYVNPFGIRSLRGVNVSRMLKNKSLKELDLDDVENLQRQSMDRQILQNIQKTLNSKLNLRIARETHQRKEIEKWKSEEMHRRKLEYLKSEHEEELARFKQEEETRQLNEAMIRDKEEVNKYLSKNPATDMSTVDKWQAKDALENLPSHVIGVVDVLLDGKQSEETIFKAVSGLCKEDPTLIAKVAQYIANYKSNFSKKQITRKTTEKENNQQSTNQQIMIFQQVEKVQIGTSSPEMTHLSDSEEEVYNVVEADAPPSHTMGASSSEDVNGRPTSLQSQADFTEDTLGSPECARRKNPRRATGSPIEGECLQEDDYLNDDEVDNSGSDISPGSSHPDGLQLFNFSNSNLNTETKFPIQYPNDFPNKAAIGPTDNGSSLPPKTGDGLSLDEETGAKYGWSPCTRKSPVDTKYPAAKTCRSQAEAKVDEDKSSLEDFVMVDLSERLGLKEPKGELGIEMRNLQIHSTDDDEDETDPLKVNQFCNKSA